MPTALIKNGMKFFFYSNEHQPRHMHISKGDNFAKYDLENGVFLINYFNKNETRIIVEILIENKTLFLEKWNEYFNQR